MRGVEITNQAGAKLTDVLIADTAALRLKGLLGRNQITSEQGLLITPCNSVHTIGMKFPIDVLYLNKNNQIVKVVSNMKPLRMSWSFTATKVLEIAAHNAAKKGFKKGDVLSW